MGATTAMTGNRLMKLGLAALLAVALVGGVAVVVRRRSSSPTTITAYFTNDGRDLPR